MWVIKVLILLIPICFTVYQVEDNKIPTDACFHSSKVKTDISAGRTGVSRAEGTHRQEQK
jgi:hypothetical protein